jgi:4-amino-4-deoxy-L-arabinose transferase-like glycosyltransferase
VFSLNPPHPNLFSEDTMDDSYIYYVPLRLFMSVFGSGLGPARFGVALWGLALIPPAYLLARELFGRRVALIGALILAVEPFHINWSRLNVPQVYAVTWTAVALYFVILGLRTGKPAAWICAGLATGIAQYGHTDARFIPIIVALILGYELLRAPGRLLSQRYNIGWFLLAAVLGYGPTLFYVIHQPVLWQSRSGALLITSSGWLARESASVGMVRALAEQVYTNAVPMLSQTPDADFFFPRASMLPPWCIPFAVAGAIRCAVRPWQRGPYVLLTWGGAIFVLGGILVTPLFGSQHIIEIATPLALLTATGIDWVASLLPRLRAPLSFGLAALLAASGLYYFFVQYQPLPARYEIPLYKDDTMTEVGRFVHGVRPDARVYLFNDQMTDYYANLQAPWLAGDREDVVNVMDGEAPPPLHAGRSGAVFMFLPSYVEKLAAVKAKFPGGRITRVYAPYLPNHPLATVYIVGHPLRKG